MQNYVLNILIVGGKKKTNNKLSEKNIILEDFDFSYFKQIKEENNWIAFNYPNCFNNKYFCIVLNGKKIGIIGICDNDTDKNLLHVIIESGYRGQKYATKASYALLYRLNLPYLTLTIDIDNTPSLKAFSKDTNIKQISSDIYEKKYHKKKYILMGF